uniref:Nucleotidyltransferase family protein n=1 Tax=Thermomicrobium roseum TaxID=500 RepID=A0A7C5RU32_THERO
MTRVAGIVLAAGFSRRLGQPKQLVNLCGKPALQYVLNAARQAPLEPLIVVLSPQIAVAGSGLDTTGFAVVINERASEGQSTSIQAGLAALPPDVDAVVFLLGDQPFLDPSVINRLVTCFERTHAPIVRPRYVDGPGHPVLIARALFSELRALHGDVGARPVLAAHAEEIVECEILELASPLDLDTPEDVERVRRRCQERALHR